MEEDYKYLEAKSINELIEIIDTFTDIDETIEALYILSDLNEEKTLEKGMYFLWNNEVDEFFQARVVGLLGFIDIDKVFYCLINRNDEIQPYLLGDLMREISGRGKSENIVEYANTIYKKYNLLDSDEKNSISEEYNYFMDEFKTCINDLK